MGLLRDENALYTRKAMAKIAPAVELIANASTIGTAFWVRVLITDENNVSVTDATAAYDLNDYKTKVDGVANSGNTSANIAKDANGVVSLT